MAPLPEKLLQCAPGRRENRRLAMINAARQLFIERGFDGVNMSDVVRISGGSLSTLYDLFENKQGLLAAVLQNKRSYGLERVDSIVAQGKDPVATLNAMARQIHSDFTQKEMIGLLRVAMGESLRNPEFATQLYEQLHLPAIAELAAIFQSWVDAGLACIEDPTLAANLFFAMLLHNPQTRSHRIAEGAAVSDERILSETVRVFTAAYMLRSTPIDAC